MVQLLPAMDSNSVKEMSSWLSSHLINTKLSWPYWQAWSEEYSSTTSPQDSVHKTFIRMLLEKCSRVTDEQKLKTSLPVSLHDAILSPFVPKTDPIFVINRDNMMNNKDMKLSKIAIELKQRINMREDQDDLMEWLEDQQINDNDEQSKDDKDLLISCRDHWRLELFIKSILIIGGNKTLSQLMSLLDRYNEVIREMSEDTTLGGSKGGQQVNNNNNSYYILICS